MSCQRVSSEEEARVYLPLINAIKKEHYKATHNCSAIIRTKSIKRLQMESLVELKDVRAGESSHHSIVVSRLTASVQLGAGGSVIRLCWYKQFREIDR